MRPFVVAVFVFFLGFMIHVFIKSGAWKSVEISEVELGPLQMIYKDHVGPYHKIIAVIEDVETWSKSQKIDCTESFGEYLDDPNIVEHERLRSRGGCLVTGSISEALPEGMKMQTLPRRKYIQGLFKGSPALGPLKAYGKIQDYMAQQKYTLAAPILEIYKRTEPQSIETQYLFAY